MQAIKFHSRRAPSPGRKNRINRRPLTASLVWALVCLTGGLALPGYGQSQPGWIFTSNLNTSRYRHTATLLENGKVLVAGGGNRSTELYDPATGTWSLTGDLTAARQYHTATRLQNGQVLVAGGYSDVFASSYVTSAELYDPATGQWRPTGSFTTIRGIHAATLLANGKVLAVGSPNPDHFDDIIYSAELYDPATEAWSNTGSPGIFVHLAVLLPNGKVLAVYERFAQLYDPDTERWSFTGNRHRSDPILMVTLLRNGKVLVTGGFFSELYDPATETWSVTGGLNTYRYSHTATLLPDGKVLVAGGQIRTGREPRSVTLTNSAELYDPATEAWSFTTPLRAGRVNHTATLLPDGQVLVAGGSDGVFDGPTLLSSAELLAEPDALPVALPSIISASASGRRLVVRGENFDPGAVILVNGAVRRTRNSAQSPNTKLIGKGPRIAPGQRVTLRVLNLNGTLSNEVTVTGPRR